jgi:hypothetical protein
MVRLALLATQLQYLTRYYQTKHVRTSVIGHPGESYAVRVIDQADGSTDDGVQTFSFSSKYFAGYRTHAEKTGNRDRRAGSIPWQPDSAC